MDEVDTHLEQGYCDGNDLNSEETSAFRDFPEDQREGIDEEGKHDFGYEDDREQVVQGFTKLDAFQIQK